MATAAANDVASKLVPAGTLELKTVDLDPFYTGLVVLSREKIIVVDYNASQVRLHSLQDGRLLAVYSTESRPWDTCVCNKDETQMAVSLTSGWIEILAVTFTNQTEITRIKILDVRRCFDGCLGVKYLNEKLVVSGFRIGSMCWGVVSITDGHMETIHNICKCGKYSGSFLCTNNNDMVFISCDAGRENPDVTGVYGYRNSRREFLYQHKDLNSPFGVTMERRHVYVCNFNPPCIHEMTESGQPLTIHTQGIEPSSRLMAIHWDQQDGLLYVTGRYSNVITRFRPEYSDHQDPVIPEEVLKMDTISLDMYKKALRGGKEKVHSIRVMVVGQYGVGKTTLTKRLLGKDVNISERKSTEGIDVHIECSKVSLSSGEWTAQGENAEQYLRLQRLVKLINEHAQKQEASGELEGQSGMDNLSANKEHENEHRAMTSNSQAIDQLVQSKTTMKKSNLLPPSQQTQPSIAKMDKRRVEHAGQKTTNFSTPSGEAMSSTSATKDAVIEILHLVNKNTDKLEKNIEEYASLAMWDFAGQYVFYTTHQTFLTSRAIYLLVIDLSQQVNDLVEDECFLDIEGMKRCKVHDLIDIWLNSIHSCTPSTDSGIPPVILVGTHVDKIPEKSRQKVIDEYYRTVRRMLKDKPTILHLKGDIVIDNTKSDPKLKELQKRVFELATQQPHWGEERPARWLPLEQAIMTLKASGAKVAPLSLVEEINRSGSVRIEDKSELELFLRFQHEMGTILYFSVDGLREKIVLEPQWLIDALKSLITAEMFISINPVITRKWFEFKEDGKLTWELIDAIWTKTENPDFHDNKEHILLLMEKLHIIARPRSYGEDGKIKEDNFYLAPCMLRQATPKEVIYPESNTQKESTSVLCFMSKQKFLPPPVFHRLVGACLTHWPIAKQQELANQIYCGCCVFDLDLHHRLTLYFREYVIFARIIRMGVTDISWSSEVCIKARNFIFENLSRIIGNVGNCLQVELHVQCPNSDAGSLEGLIPVTVLQKNENVPCHSHRQSHTLVSRLLLKFWFKEEGTRGKKVGDTGKHHRNVLNRCLSALVKDLDFQTVSIYIQEKELFDDVTLRDILDQKTTSEKIRELIKRIQQRDRTTYDKFKECLVQASQAFLKDMLEEEEAKDDKCTVS